VEGRPWSSEWHGVASHRAPLLLIPVQREPSARIHSQFFAGKLYAMGDGVLAQLWMQNPRQRDLADLLRVQVNLHGLLILRSNLYQVIE